MLKRIKIWFQWFTIDLWISFSLGIYSWSSHRLRKQVFKWLKAKDLEGLAYRTIDGRVLCVVFLALPIGDLSKEENFYRYTQVCNELSLSYKAKLKSEFRNFEKVFDDVVVETFSRKDMYLHKLI